jgi:hypothetical protein
MRTGIFLGVLLILLGGGMARTDTLYVTASSLNVRLCPKPDCPVADKLAYGTQVTVHERDGDWARVSDYTDAAKVREKHPDLGASRWPAGWRMNISAKRNRRHAPHALPTDAFYICRAPERAG